MKKIILALLLMIVCMVPGLALAHDYTYAGRFYLRSMPPIAHNADMFLVNHLINKKGEAPEGYLPYDVYYTHDHATDRGDYGLEYANQSFEFDVMIVPLNIYNKDMGTGLYAGTIDCHMIIAAQGVYGIKLTDFYIALIDKCIEYYQPDGILLHDDWGHQRGYFFSPAVLDEVFVPHFKRLSDYVHSKGMFFELHSCGLNEQNVPYMIKAGIDLWIPQPMNDQKKLVKQYGDQIMIGVDWPVYSPDDPDEVVEKLAKDFFEEMKDYRFYYNDRRQPDMRFAKYLYRLGRAYY